MQGGIIGSVCFLAFLLCLKAEELTLTTPEDLKTVVPESNTVLESKEEETRSGAVAESSAFSDGGSAKSEAIAESNGGSSSAQSIASGSGYGSSAQSKAIASSDSDAQATSAALASGNNRGYPYRVPTPTSSSAQAVAEANSGYNPQNSYSPGYPSSKPSSGLNPYGSGLTPYSLNPSSSAQAEAEAQASVGGSYNVPSPYSSLPYGSGINSAQEQAETDALVSGSTYQGYNPYSPRPFSSGLSPYSSSNVAQAEAEAQVGNGGNFDLGMPPSLSPYGVDSSSAQAQATAQVNQGSSSYGSGFDLYSPYNPSVAQGDGFANLPTGSVNYNPSGSPNALRSQAQAQAQSMSTTIGGGGNPFNSGLNPSPYSGLSSAKAQAQADVQTGGGSNSYNPYSSYNPYRPASSSAQAEAIAQANSMNNPALNPYMPSSYNMKPSSASAKAAAQASNGGGSPYNTGQYPYYPSPQPSPYASGSNSASASAEATANGAGTIPYSPSVPLGTGYPFSAKELVTQSLAEAQAQSTLGGNQYGPGLTPSGYYNTGSAAQSQAEASAQAISNSAASVKSRTLLPFEYVYPNKYGPDGGLLCTRYHDIIYTSSPEGLCMVCFCLKEHNMGMLYPVCATCAGCQAPDPQPVPPPQPFPEPYPIVTTPSPNPDVSVTCSPLPSGQPFSNPLNPCQICICRESVNMIGKPDVKIECQENPHCVLPPDVTTLPPVPDVPKPIPLPLCEKFPSNVLFPHPSDVCKLCKCSVELSEYGLPERQITCYPNPDCNQPAPQPEPPVPPYDPITVPPIPYPFPPDPRPGPQPFPEPITAAPIPWPPVTTPAPPSPGPLPGPSPHESCHPFPPNQPFQHPWDECQLCLCTEAYATGLITVEVNCYTKKTCCIEPPDNYIPVNLPPPTPYPVPGTIIIQDSICEFKTFGVEFRNPDNNCQVCICLPTNGVVSTSCKQLYSPECLPYSGGSASAEAQASSDAFNGLVPFTGSTYRPSPYSPYSSEGQSQASAEANAISNAQSPYYVPDQYSGRPILYSGSQGETQGQAQSQGYGQLSAAEAEANANLGYQQPYSSNLTPGRYISPGVVGGSNRGFSSIADLQALNLGNRYKNPSYGGYDRGQALGNTPSGLNYNQYNPMLIQSVPASVMYPTLYSRPSYEITPLYQPRQFRDGSAQAQAQGMSLGSNARSQAIASAQAEERSQTKSGYPEEGDLD